MVKRKGTSRDKWKRKQWYTVLAPKQFNETVVGETPAEEDKQLIGRRIEVNASDLTGDSRKANLKIELRITAVNGTQAQTAIESLSTSKGYLKAITRRKSTKVDLVVAGVTKDNVQVLFKPSIFTLKKAQSSTKKQLRARLVELTKKVVLEKTFDEIISEILNSNYGNTTRDDLKKIAPMKSVETRIFGINRRPTSAEKKRQRKAKKEEVAEKEKGKEQKEKSTEA